MTYNAAPRRRFTEKQRAAFLLTHGSTCYWCNRPIKPGQPWDIEHKIARELLPDASADDDTNLAPIHSHPDVCHKIKTAMDRKAIAKSNRIQRKHGPVEDRKKPAKPLRGRPFQQGHRPLKSGNTFKGKNT